MLFSSRISLSTMVNLCQAFRVADSAGLPIARVFEMQAQRGPIATRPILTKIAARLKQGDSLEDALAAEGTRFPTLFTTMVTVGEQTGNSPEIFRELERYYREQLTLKRQLIQQLMWPVIEFVLAIGVITLAILIFGWLPTVGGKSFDPIGFGVGLTGVIRFWTILAVFFGFLIGVYLFATQVLGQRAAVHRVLLKIPAIGPCLQALILSRLSLALKLTMDSSLSVPKAIRRSMSVSGNGAYEACAEPVATDIKKGGDVTEAMTRCGLFPEEFLQAVHAGEQSGQLPEVMGRQSEHYREVASFRLTILNRAATVTITAVIMAILAFGILRIANNIYGSGGVLDRAGSMDLSKPLID